MADDKNQKPFIDVREVIKKKNKGATKLIPNFVINLIKRIIHEDEINKVISDSKHLNKLEFISGVLNSFEAKYEVIGAENIPSDGRFIFVANHPLGGLDGIVFTDAISKYFKNIKFVVNDLLLNIKNFDGVFIPINKHGKQSMEYVRNIENLFASDDQILFFPAGLCSRKINGKIIDLEWKKTFVQKAIKHKRDIIPVYFEGKNSNLFYTLARIRKFFKIKLNIEMFLLPREMFKQKGQTIKLYIGKPINHKSLDKTKKPEVWAQEIKEITYNLAHKYKHS